MFGRLLHTEDAALTRRARPPTPRACRRSRCPHSMRSCCPCWRRDWRDSGVGDRHARRIQHHRPRPRSRCRRPRRHTGVRASPCRRGAGATWPGQASAIASRSSSVQRWTPCPGSPIGARVRLLLHRRRQGEQLGVRRMGDRAGRPPARSSSSTTSPAWAACSTPRRTTCQARAVRDMFVMMGKHPRLDTAAIQTVGTKGWDGFAVARVGPSPSGGGYSASCRTRPRV